MKFKDLKELIDGMTENQLNQELLYKSDEYSISGKVSKVEIAEDDLYWNGDDDPSEIKTKAEWLEDGYDEEDIDEMIIEIPKGSYFIEIGISED